MGSRLTRQQESQLVLAVRAGDQRAARQLVEIYHPRLVQYFKGHAKGPAFVAKDYDDIAMHSLYKGYLSFDPAKENRLITLCITIGGNMANDLMRVHCRRNNLSVWDKIQNRNNNVHSDSPDIYSREDRNAALLIWDKIRQDIINSATHPNRTAVSLDIYEDITFRGMPYAIAAIIYRFEIGTVKSRMHYVRTKVEEHLKSRNSDESSHLSRIAGDDQANRPNFLSSMRRQLAVKAR
jgi:DNA-directed RNA polymerase specialized sigma24 family protein